MVSDENNSVQIRASNIQGEGEMGGLKFGAEIRSNRRDLSVINGSLGGVNPNPCVVNKRGYPGSNGVFDKNLPMPAHRPITRRYAAQVAASQYPFIEVAGVKKAKTSNEFIVWEDAPLTDAENHDIAKDRSMPMCLEQSELEISDEDQMEVEMEDMIEDIDGCDAKNPLAVVDYVCDLYAYYKKMEVSSCVPVDYMLQQIDINERMRAILIDWLIEVHHKFDLWDETLYLTVNLIDRFLAKQNVVKKKLQLVGLVAMLLACKYEEVSVPVVDDLVFISDKAYTRKEVLEMERIMLNVLQFNLSVPTPYAFMKRILKAAKSDKKVELLSFFLMELGLVEYEMVKYPPSLLAAAAVYTAQLTLHGTRGGHWSRTCEWHSGYSEDQLLECSRLMVGFHEKAGSGKLRGVYRKYDSAKYGYAARCEVAHFLMQ